MQQQLQISCPYNSQHIMAPDRLIFHLSNECKDSLLHKTEQNNTQQNFLKIFRGQLSVQSNNSQIELNSDLQIQMNSSQVDFQSDISTSKINEENQNQTQKQMDNQFIDQFNNLNLTYQSQQLQKQELNFDEDIEMI